MAYHEVGMWEILNCAGYLARLTNNGPLQGIRISGIGALKTELEHSVGTVVQHI